MTVSIPQAVSTIAMSANTSSCRMVKLRFNTASGKYYCNANSGTRFMPFSVSIPQAVSTIAIDMYVKDAKEYLAAFQYRKR